MTEKILSYGHQTIEEDDIAAVSAALRAEYLTGGPRVEEYERAFAAATGAANAVACSSGTAALHLAVMALGLRPGEAAIVPSMTFVATANVVRMCGAEVVFADVDRDTGLMTADTFAQGCDRAARAGQKVTVALPVHLNGQVCDLPAIAAIADRNGIALVEDACHALGSPNVGATQRTRLACFSTHPVKAIATGEGGVVTSADKSLAKAMRAFRSHGIIREASAMIERHQAFDGPLQNPWYYEMHEIGWNYRIPDILCALGISQLRKLDRFYRRRVELARRYDCLLAPLAPAVQPVPHDACRPHGWHLYAVLIDFARIGLSRARFMDRLRAEGVGSQVHYIPVHRQPYYRRRYGALSLPGADAYYARCLSLPLYPLLTDTEVERVVTAIRHTLPGFAAATL
jgi:UDP-4-amino-4,6-dideoxy-N-acetyl-beta-L-altrosamine transaminase